MEIKLNGQRGGIALVDSNNYENMKKYNWHQTKKGYARGTVNGTKLFMHQLIMGFSVGMVIDHINHKRLDNRKDNLRFISDTRNGKHTKKKIGSITKYRGVTFDKRRQKYSVFITHDNSKKYLGSFNTEIEAAEYYDMYIIHNKMDEINLNFPNNKNEYLTREFKINVKKPENKNTYIGIKKVKNSYQAFIEHNNKQIYLKSSNDPVECAKTYDKYIIDNNILGKKINFPEDYPEYVNKKKIKTQCEEISNKTVKLIINTKEKINALIDKEDYDKIKYYKCTIGDGYVRLTINAKLIKLHTYLLNPEKGFVIDHKDNNRANNTRDNLRILNIQGNNQNKSKTPNTSSKYIGVSKRKDTGKWSVCISRNNKRINLGNYDNEEYAARKRDLYILINYPNDYFKLNFLWNEEDITKWKNIFKL